MNAMTRALSPSTRPWDASVNRGTRALNAIRRARRAALALSACSVAAASGQLFTEGNLVVARAGDWYGSGIEHAATFVQLVEYTPAGFTTGVSVLLPTMGGGATHACTISVTGPNEGHLTRSADGRFLVLAGYDAPPTTPHIAASTFNRVIARIDSAGTVDTTMVLPSEFSGVSINAACSATGAEFWAVGGNSNIVYAHLGGTNTIIDNGLGPATNRVIDIDSGIRAGRLFASTAPFSSGVATVGVGLPTTAGASAVTLLQGMPAPTFSFSDGFFFSDANTLYIADDSDVEIENGGLQKWTYSSGPSAWTMAYILRTGLTTGLRGLTGVNNNGTVTLYATTADTYANELVSVVDTGSASPFTVLAMAPGVSFRGVAFAPISTALTGACCIAGLCHTVSAMGCTAAGGVYSGNSTLCANTVCQPGCYANCDGSTAPPRLNVLDFSCFLFHYAARDAYADCDQNGTLNILDFACFLNKFANGCP